MTTEQVIDKLSEYTSNITVAIEVKEDIGLITPAYIFYQDLSFRVEKFKDDSSEKPYYKLIIFSKEQQQA